MANLYQLADQYKQFNEWVDAALDSDDLTEDDLQGFIDTLEYVQDGVEGKVENIVKFLKNIEGDINSYKEEEKRLAKKRKYLENKYDGLKQYTQNVLETMGIEKVNAGIFRVRLQKNPPSVNILNEGLIPGDYKIAMPDKVDNKAILEVLKAGGSISGVEIVDNKKHLRIT